MSREPLKWRLKERIAQAKNVVWDFVLPHAISEKIYAHYKGKKMMREQEVVMNNAISREELFAAMDKLDLQSDVMLHSSLVEIGNIEKRHKAVAEYLQKQLLDKGYTILNIAIPIKGSTEEYVRGISRFDKDAPNAMGALSKYYGAMPNAWRSLSPTHSVVAVGPKAAYYTAEHHLDETPCGVHSSFRKLVEQNGTIVMIGAAMSHLTFVHLLEDELGEAFPFHVYSKHPYPVDIYRDGECIHHGHYYAHNKRMGALRVMMYPLHQIEQLPSTKVVSLGASKLIAMNARDALRSMLKELRDGNSIYGHCCVSAACKNKIEERLRWLDNL